MKRRVPNKKKHKKISRGRREGSNGWAQPMANTKWQLHMGFCFLFFLALFFQLYLSLSHLVDQIAHHPRFLTGKKFSRSVTKNDTSLSNWYRDCQHLLPFHSIRLFVFGFHVKVIVCVFTYVLLCVFVHGKTGTILLLDTHIMWQLFGWQECCTHCVYTFTPKKGETYIGYCFRLYACASLGDGLPLGGEIDMAMWRSVALLPSFIVMWIRTCTFCTKLYICICMRVWCVCVNDEKQNVKSFLNFQKLMES